MGTGRTHTLFIELLWQDPAYFATWVAVIAFSICIHELAHVMAATSQGDTTALRGGYATLDPRRLMGVSSLITLALFGIAWGAVPVNPSRMRHRWSHAFVSASGPGANLVLAGVGALAFVLTSRFIPGNQALLLLFSCLLKGNCLLALLNLMPIPMFDGWDIYTLVLPALKRLSQDTRNTLTWVLVVVLFFSPANVLFLGASETLARALRGMFSACLL